MNKGTVARGISVALMLLGAGLIALSMLHLYLILDQDGEVISGLLLSLGGLAGTVAFRRAHISNTGSLRGNRLGMTALIVAVAANLLVLPLSSELFLVSPGDSIRPLGWVANMLFLDVATLIIVLPISVMALIKERPKVWGVIGIVLSMTPSLFSGVLLHVLSKVIGFNLSS